MESSIVKVARREVPVSNLDKVLYPAGPFTKAQVLDYYRRIAPVLLPHFKNRPVTLVRYPDGVNGEAFYEKNAPGFAPSWIKTFPVPRSEGGLINYILINNLPTLIWAANLAALELHPFLHRAPRLDTPTHLVFDLDPGEPADLLTCCDVALLVRDVLSHLELKCFPKVSGSKGIQLYVPLNTRVSYDDTRPFARAVAELLVKKQPRLVVSEMAKTLRVGKVFIDWSQNHPTKTTVGVYSLRAKRERPLVSLPISWGELEKATDARDAERLTFSPESALSRVKEHGDLFEPVLRLKQHLPRAFEHALNAFHAPKPLAQYASKRNFSRTAEPEPVIPRRSAQGSRRRFVIQKHATTRLHYDFRLEIGDVLKSWAVPKEIPLVRGERRSAFPTEDHPLDYLQFEGIIPKGQYGGGTVMVWDIGTFEPVSGNYHSGQLTVFLSGQKLKGEWTLVRMKASEASAGKETWLLIKTSADAPKLNRRKAERSALTGRTMDEIAEQRTAVWNSDRAESNSAGGPVEPRKPNSVPAPKFVSPMKPTLVDALPEGKEWSYEIKWDGYRALAAKHGDEVELLSQKANNLAGDFPSVVATVRTIKADTALLDGEIVAVDAKGRPSFQALQNRASMGKGWRIVYYAFDLLNMEGEDLRGLPLSERKHRLESVLEGSTVRCSAALPGTAAQVVDVVRQNGLEGVVAKQIDSTYSARKRSLAWRKFKVSLAQEFVIGGYNPEQKTFSSLLVGYYEGDRLMFAGKVRQGLNPGLRAKLMKAMRPLITKDCPFANLPTSKTGHFGEGITKEEMAELQWVRPELVAQVSFTEWTNYGLLRHATFLGLREDKPAAEVVRESPVVGADAIRV